MSLVPVNGLIEDFDFKIAMNEPEFGYIGLQAEELVLKGVGKSQDGTEFSFKAPVDQLKMEIEKTAEDEEEVIKFNPHASKLDVKQLELEIGTVQSDDLSLSAELAKRL